MPRKNAVGAVLLVVLVLAACLPQAAERPPPTQQARATPPAEATQIAEASTERDRDSDVDGAGGGRWPTTDEDPNRACFPQRGMHSWSWWQTFFRWSPDGREIFVTRGPVLFEASADGASVRTIARGPVDRPDVMSTMIPFDIAPDGRQALIAVCSFPRPTVGPSDSRDGFGPRHGGREVGGRTYRTYGYELVEVDLGRGHQPGPGVMDPARELGPRGAPRRLTFNRVFDGYPAWAPDGRRVAFLQELIHEPWANFDGARRLVTLAADGGNARVLVEHDSHDQETGLVLHQPAWSPDGRRLAFAAAAGRTQVGLYTVPVDGAAPRRLRFLRPLATTMSAPAWSPDGRRLAFASVEDGTLSLFTIRVDGSERRRVAAIRTWEAIRDPQWQAGSPRLFGTIADVAWSPDGTKLLFTYGTAVCVVSMDGVLVGQATRHPTEAPGSCLAADQIQKFEGPQGWTANNKYEAVAAWSPRGNRVAFAFAVGHTFRHQDSRDVELWLYTMAPDGSDVQPVVRPGLGGRPVPAAAEHEDVITSRAACAAGFVVPQPGAHAGLVRDCQTLVDLREALLAERRPLTNWASGTPIDEWIGVTVAGTPPRVTAIDLSGNRLSGRVPPGLGNLTYLQTLDLSRNSYTGPIPGELGRLLALRRLDLSKNRLTGTIPPQVAKASNLEYLSLGDNQLHGPIPPEVGQLTYLTDLGLARNALTGQIPSALGQLTRLRSLNLRDNDLTGPIPGELGMLTVVESVKLQGNRLTGCIPAELRPTREQDLRYLGLAWCEAA